MESRTSASRWRVVLLAATRLAGLYAIGTALLLLPFFLVFEGTPQGLRDLIEFAKPIAFAFALAFILLAVARRAGLVALWLLLGALWVLILHDSVVGHTDFAGVFVAWSALAIPLAILGGLGVPATLRLRLGPWNPAALTLAMMVWAALLVPALALSVPSFSLLALSEVGYRLAFGIGRFIWGPAALLIVALSIVHVWAGTAPIKADPLSNRDDW
jgi:hypothetical protein